MPGTVSRRMLSRLGRRAPGTRTRAERPSSCPIRAQGPRRPPDPAMGAKRAVSPSGKLRVTLTLVCTVCFELSAAHVRAAAGAGPPRRHSHHRAGITATPTAGEPGPPSGASRTPRPSPGSSPRTRVRLTPPGCQVHTRASGLVSAGGHVMMWPRGARAFRWSTVSSSTRGEEAQHGEGAQVR